MKSGQLHDLWSSPDNSRLTTKQISFRLPVHIAAKIAALCEMYPQKNRTQIVADLLTSALDDLEKNLPESLGEALSGQDEYEQRELASHLGEEYVPIYSLGGARGRYRRAANCYYADLEKGLGNEGPEKLYEDLYFTEEGFKARNA